MILTQLEIIKVIDAISESGIDLQASRPAFLHFIEASFRNTLPHNASPNVQLMQDIGRMNEVEQLTSGQIPLQIYFKNVSMVLKSLVQQAVILHALDLVTQRMSGAPKIDLSQVPETKEKWIHRDDTLPFGFMQLGLETAKAVMKISVPAFENGLPKNQSNGTQMVARGTAWLLTSSLIVTNHHVINARRENEPDAALADLKLQSSEATVIFDFNDQLDEGTILEAISLEAWDKTLDYAIIRIENSGRTPIRLANDKMILGEDPIAVNIIQHPFGERKKFAIRNNMVSGSTDNDLRYFTDTETGSSGAPVFNDLWEAVALHRGATSVNNVSFQGKTTAFVNVGTHLSSILDHVKNNFPALAGEFPV